MKVLQLCLRVPWPPNDGGNIAMLNMSRLLSRAGEDVTIFALNTLKHYVAETEWPEELSAKYKMTSTQIDTGVSLAEAFFNLFRAGESYNVSRFYAIHANEKLKKILQETEFDIILAESLFCMPYIETLRKYSNAKVILRSHNIEHVIWQQLSRQSGSPLKRIYLSFLAKRLKKAEEKFCRLVDGIVPITRNDADYFRSIAPGIPILPLPIGIDLNDYPDQTDVSPTTTLSLFHLGAMDWQPNVDAVNWFLDQCWEKIHQKHPNLDLYLAGRGFPSTLLERKIENVHMTGGVENANEYMEGKHIMIVPLHSGSGLRIKILQGLALGKTIISTSIGCEGIDVKDKETILIANTPEEFIEAVSYCIKNPGQALAIGKKGRELIQSDFANGRLAEALHVFLESIIT